MKKSLVLKQRYQIKKKIGQGGFAVTYLALDLKTNKQCVIKYLSLKQVDQWKSIELFEREAKILANLDYPQIPYFIDFFTINTPGDNKLYLVQEYIKGENLAQLINNGKHFTEHEAINIALEITKTLEYLHNFSPPLIHRDIKPSNILLAPGTQNKDQKKGVYLIDFGAVRDKMLQINRGDSTFVGTYGYIPPEQYDGRPVKASDIYSLGATIIYILSHKEPSEIEKNKLKMNFMPFVNISKNFTTVLTRMIEPDWKDRYQTASQLRRDLENLSSGEIPGLSARKKFIIKKRQLFSILLIIITSIAIIYTGTILHKKYVKHKQEAAKIEFEKTQKEKKYKQSIELINQKKYSNALAILNELYDYKDSKEKIREVNNLINKGKEEKYVLAIELFNKKKYTEAKNIFLEIDDYKDSTAKIKKASELIEKENYKKQMEKINKMPLTKKVFFDAIINNDLLIVENFLSRGMDVNSREPQLEYSTDKTALMVAAQYEHADMVKLLLKYKPDVNAKNSWNHTALDFAKTQSNTEIINILIDAGAK